MFTHCSGSSAGQCLKINHGFVAICLFAPVERQNALIFEFEAKIDCEKNYKYFLVKIKNFSPNSIVGVIFLSLHPAASSFSFSSRRLPKLQTQHQTLNITLNFTHSTSHIRHHTIDITHSISHTTHPSSYIQGR